MSLQHTAYIICCDGCGECLKGADGKPVTFPYNVSAIQAADAAGWLVNQPGMKDYCPECRKQKENEYKKP